MEYWIYSDLLLHMVLSRFRQFHCASVTDGENQILYPNVLRQSAHVHEIEVRQILQSYTASPERNNRNFQSR